MHKTIDMRPTYLTTALILIYLAQNGMLFLMQTSDLERFSIVFLLVGFVGWLVWDYIKFLRSGDVNKLLQQCVQNVAVMALLELILSFILKPLSEDIFHRWLISGVVMIVLTHIVGTMYPYLHPLLNVAVKEDEYTALFKPFDIVAAIAIMIGFLILFLIDGIRFGWGGWFIIAGAMILLDAYQHKGQVDQARVSRKNYQRWIGWSLRKRVAHAIFDLSIWLTIAWAAINGPTTNDILANVIHVVVTVAVAMFFFTLARLSLPKGENH